MLHQYKQGGKNIVMDINSGAIHVMDDLGYAICELLPQDLMSEECPKSIIEKLEQYPEQDIRET